MTDPQPADAAAPATWEARLAAGEPRGTRPLAQLVARLIREGRLHGPAPDAPDVDVTGVAYDSRAVKPGNVFFAVPGEHVDGHDYVARAGAAGACAAVVERKVDAEVSQVVVDRSLLALATGACWWYGDPSAELGVVGVTGTDGKTSTTRLCAAVLDAAGMRAGVVSTVGGRIGGIDEISPAHATTPQAPELQRALAAIHAAGDPVAVVETTSHGLAQGRVNGVRYDVAILTNLTHEHLDFHQTWDAYRDAKRSLFEKLAVGDANPPKPRPGWARSGIVNADDPSAGAFIETTMGAGARVITYGRAAHADLRLIEAEDDGRRLHLTWDGPDGRRRVALQLAGRFNAYNALAAAALGAAVGLDPAAVEAGLQGVAGIPGRMERIELGQPFSVIVDYAHSPNALAMVLDELAPNARARGGGLIAVFGSAGERDVGKRPLMGRIAAERCRLVIATDEDPRNEDPQAILEAIAAGAESAGAVHGESVLLIQDRREAITAAMRAARPGDVVLLAGKGHERCILGPNGSETPWDERAAAVEALRELGFGA